MTESESESKILGEETAAWLTSETEAGANAREDECDEDSDCGDKDNDGNCKVDVEFANVDGGVCSEA
jgi:hypothetical protein